ALVLHALVLAAQALVVLDRPEDARAEQAVALGLEGAIVDGLRLFDLAVGPGQDLFRARDRDADLVEDLSRHLRAEKIHALLIHRLPLGRCSARNPAPRRAPLRLPQNPRRGTWQSRCRGLLDRPAPAFRVKLRAMTTARAARPPLSATRSFLRRL